MPRFDAYYVISPLLGAVIGYITNWVAIKMLFRPHSGKYLFGKRIPFTPGLIPSRRFVLSKKAGETITKHLLTDDTFIKSLCRNEVKESFASAIEVIIDDIKKSDKTVKELLFGKDSFAKGENSRLADRLTAIVEGDGFFSFTADIDRKLITCEKTIEDILTLSDNVKILIHENSGLLSKKIISIIESPFFEDKVKPVIMSIIEQNVKGLAALFVTPEKIYTNFLNSACQYLDNHENYDTTAEKISQLWDKAASLRISDLAAACGGRDGQILSAVLRFDETAAGDGAVNIRNILKERTIGKIADSLMQVKVRDIFSVSDTDLFCGIKKEIMDSYDSFIVSHMPRLIKTLDLSLMIEEKINGFGIQEAEDIIISVVDKELRAITYFGAILGFIIGIVPPVLQFMGYK